MLPCVSVLQTEMHFYQLGEDASWELLEIVCEGRSKTGAVEKEECSSHTMLLFTQANYEVI